MLMLLLLLLCDGTIIIVISEVREQREKMFVYHNMVVVQNEMSTSKLFHIEHCEKNTHRSKESMVVMLLMVMMSIPVTFGPFQHYASGLVCWVCWRTAE